ncbi:MAG: hypothetical protein ACPGAO_09160 [Flavobacteriaceae bacterium]
MNQQPKSFYVIASIALIWNLIGVFQYLGMAYMSAETFNSLDESMQSYISNEPAWVTAAFALAVFSASIASIGLLLRKAWSHPVFVFSAVCVIAQYVYSFFIQKDLQLTTQNSIGSLFILGVALFLIFYSKRLRTVN